MFTGKAGRRSGGCLPGNFLVIHPVKEMHRCGNLQRAAKPQIVPPVGDQVPGIADRLIGIGIRKGDDALGATVRLGGVVQPETLKWDAETVDLKFNISMLPSKDDPIHVTVHAIGAPPQMFREGIGVVAEGKYDGKTFHADRVIVKHSNEYRPPAEGEKPEQLYETLMTNGS